jgi:hypothetical protein
MNSCDYYLYDQIVYVFKNGHTIKLDRSKMPRWFPGPVPEGMTRAQQIEETEDLVSHVLFEDGVWNVSGWECAMYREEFDDLDCGLSLEDVHKIVRELTYRLR